MSTPSPRALRAGLARIRRGRLTGQVAWIFGAQLIAAACGFLTIAVLARSLGPSGQGVLAVAMTVPAFLVLLVGGGLSSANTYFAGGARLRLEQLASNTLVVAAIGSALGVAIVALGDASGLLSVVLPGVTLPLAGIAVATLPVLMVRQGARALLFGTDQIARAGKSDAIQAIAYLAAVVVLVAAMQLGVAAGLVAYLISLGLGLAYAARGLPVERIRPPFRGVLRVLRATLGFGLRVNVGTLVQFLSYRLDLILVNAIVGAAAAGQYSIASRLAELLWLLPAAVGSVVFARSSASSGSEMNAVTGQAFRWVLTVGAAGAILLAATGSLAIPAIFSPAFSPSFPPLLVLLPGATLLGASSVLANDIAGRGRPGLVSLAAVVGFGLTVLLDLLLIPRLGVMGAAVASTISYSAYALSIGLMYMRVSRGDSAASASVRDAGGGS